MRHDEVALAPVLHLDGLFPEEQRHVPEAGLEREVADRRGVGRPRLASGVVWVGRQMPRSHLDHVPALHLVLRPDARWEVEPRVRPFVVRRGADEHAVSDHVDGVEREGGERHPRGGGILLPGGS